MSVGCLGVIGAVGATVCGLLIATRGWPIAIFTGGVAEVTDSVTGGLDKLFTSDEERGILKNKRAEIEALLKTKLMEVEFNYQMQLKGVEQSQIDSREENREKEKNNRLNKQSSNQSKMIEQRKRNLPSINFESNEDSLDGFDFAEFNPR